MKANNVIITDEVIEFIDKCDAKLRIKILRKVGYIKDFGLSRDVPDLKKVIGTQFWELRVLGKQNIRLFCVLKNNVYIIYAFVKKSQKTDRKDIRKAEKFLQKLDI